jgi:ribosome-associated protein
MNREQLFTELHFKAVRSSGAGGQNVNKVSSKVVFNFDIPKSQGLSEEEKITLITNLNSRLTSEIV